jgi:hypothetical protein
MPAEHSHQGYKFIHPKTGKALANGNDCKCPGCNAVLRVTHTANASGAFETAWPMTVDRIDNKLVLIGWQFTKYFNKDGSSRILSGGYEAYIVESKKIVRISGHQNFMGNIRLGPWRQIKKYSDTWGETGLIYPWDARILRGSTAENSKLNILLRVTKKTGTFPVTYLRLWQKHPQIENLVVQGASRLLTEMVKDERVNRGGYVSPFRGIPKLEYINRKEKSPFKMLGMTKDEFRRCIKGKWSAETLKFWLDEKDVGRTPSDDDLKLARSISYHSCGWLRGQGIDWIKAARYIEKQKTKDKRVDIGIYCDYLRIAQGIGEVITDPDITFPPRLMGAHDRVEQTRRQQEKLRKEAERKARAHKFAERFAELEALVWEHDGILIRPVRDEAELSQEGKELHNCVGSYAETHIRGEQPLFVIRRAGKPDTPWYTLQLNTKTLKVVQNRGSRNCERTKEIQDFENAWVTHINAQAGPKKQKRTA